MINFEQGSEKQWLAGAAEMVVTPPCPVRLGLLSGEPISDGVESDLLARALVISDGSTQIAIVTIDFVGFDFKYNSRLISRIAKAASIPRDNILICPSHNHSAPLSIPWGSRELSRRECWNNRLPGQLAKVVCNAKNSLRRARLQYKREGVPLEPVPLGLNRRTLHTGNGVPRIVDMVPNPCGPNYPFTDVLSVIGEDDREKIGVLFTYAAHPVIVHSASNKINADYPGKAVEALNKLHDQGIYMFAQGCGGDINGYKLTGGLENAQNAGELLAAAVSGEVPFNPIAEGIQTRFLIVELPLLAPDKIGKTMKFPITSFLLGNQLCILAMPHEVFVEYQIFCVEQSPFKHNLILAYTNGCECYIATEKDYLLGNNGGYGVAPSNLGYKCGPLDGSVVESRIKDGIRQIWASLDRA